jgi:hypothetical protein
MCFYENSLKIERLCVSNSSQNFGQLFCTLTHSALLGYGSCTYNRAQRPQRGRGSSKQSHIFFTTATSNSVSPKNNNGTDVSCNVRLCVRLSSYRRFEGIQSFHLQGSRNLLTLKTLNRPQQQLCENVVCLLNQL